MLDYIKTHPIMHNNLDALMHVRFLKLGFVDGFTIRNCLQHLGAKIFYKNAEFAKIAQGLIALKRIQEKQ